MIKNRLIPLQLLTFVFLFASQSLFAAVTEVTATVDKNPLTAEESFQLEVVANEDVRADAFDATFLQQDFIVGRTAVSRQTQIINFQTSKTTRWTTTLIPRKEGQFTIPAIEIDGVKTQPISLMVLPVSARNSNVSRDLFITTEVDVNEAYTQQQIRYTVKLHLAMDLQRGSLSAPEVKDADIQQMGNDKEYTEIIDGKRFRIIERVFAIIPNRSGQFVIQGPYFEGEVVDSSRQSFGFFNKTKTVNRVGRNIDITVLPMPDGYQEHWLPSEFVQLAEEWQPTEADFTVGTPITRTITLTAVGVVKEQLPEIQSQYPDRIKSYPDQANTATIERNGTFVAQRTETIALIPNASGNFTIPEVRIPWFNVITRKTEIATLPAREVIIAPSAEQAAAPPIPDSQINLEPNVSSSPNGAVSVQTPPLNLPYWSLSSWVLLALWLCTVILWIVTSKRKPAVEPEVYEDPLPSSSWQDLQKELMKKSEPNITRIQFLLRKWLAEITGNSNASLSSSLRKLNNEQLERQVAMMFEQNYGSNNDQKWDKRELLDTLLLLKKKVNEADENIGRELRPLYL